jgi:hypothetical protein
MRWVPDDVPALLAGPVIGWGSRVESWYNGARLHDDLPVATGEFTHTDVLGSESVDLEVAAEPGLLDDPDIGPLGKAGVQLRVVATVARPGGLPAEVPLGWFPIEEAAEGDDTIKVTAPGVLGPVAADRFLFPWSTHVAVYGEATITHTFAQTLRRLCGKHVPILLDGVSDRLTPNMLWERERIDAVREVLDAWPAEGHIDPSGVLLVSPPADIDGPAVLDLADGVNGTVARALPSTGEQSLFNVCVATGRGNAPTEDFVAGYRIAAVSEITSGVRRPDGPMGRRPGFFHSDMLTNEGQCEAAAAAQLDRWQREAGKQLEVTCAVDPRIEPRDIIRVNGDRCWVNEQTMPLHADSMRLVVTVL